MKKKYEMPHETFVALCREFDDNISSIINDFLENAKKEHEDLDSIAQSIAQPLMMRGAKIMRFSGMSKHSLMVNFAGLFVHNEKFPEHEIKQKPHEFLIQVAVEYLLELGFTREDIVEHVCKIHQFSGWKPSYLWLGGNPVSCVKIFFALRESAILW